MKIRLATSADCDSWDSYVNNQSTSNQCHLFGWKDVIERAYRHKGYYLLAEKESKIVGILPLCQVKSFFGKQLVSLPFLNYGGVLTDSDEAKGALIEEAVRLGKKMGTSQIELRHIKPLDLHNSAQKIKFSEVTLKVRMVLNLPESKEILLKSFKAKMRSQIFRSHREGMQVSIGGIEFLNDFYQVFSRNMRDLGSPVHSKKFFAEILTEFKSNAHIGVVQFQNQAVAAGLIICFKEVVEIPWASSLREFNKFSPNMLLYWSFLKYASDKNFKYFDFGRSTFGEGTYRFKKQWGAEGMPLHWTYLTARKNGETSALSKNKKFQLASAIWKKLPLSVTVLIGPHLRKTIPL